MIEKYCVCPSSLKRATLSVPVVVTAFARKLILFAVMVAGIITCPTKRVVFELRVTPCIAAGVNQFGCGMVVTTVDPLETIPQVKLPPDQCKKLVPVQVERPAPNKFVVVAVVVLRVVVVAFVPVALVKARFVVVNLPSEVSMTKAEFPARVFVPLQ